MPNGLLGDDTLLLEARLDESRAPSLSGLFRESYWRDLHDSGLYRPLSLALLSVQRKAFGRDPAFFAFYRSMQAYELGLKGVGADTRMILSPDSEFFKYFNNPTGGSGHAQTKK